MPESGTSPSMVVGIDGSTARIRAALWQRFSAMWAGSVTLQAADARAMVHVCALTGRPGNAAVQHTDCSAIIDYRPHL
jgi:hypothetical protein